jgi:hypothetical protein
VIRRLPGWADSASDTIVTVRRRVWGQIRRFRRRVPPLHPAPERFDHGEQHSQDASQQERDSRRQVPVSAESLVSARWLFSRMKTSRSNNRTAQSAEAIPHCADPGTFRPLLRGRLRRCGASMDGGRRAAGLRAGDRDRLDEPDALPRTAPTSEQQGCDPSVTVSS